MYNMFVVCICGGGGVCVMVVVCVLCCEEVQYLLTPLRGPWMKFLSMSMLYL